VQTHGLASDIGKEDQGQEKREKVQVERSCSRSTSVKVERRRRGGGRRRRRGVAKECKQELVEESGCCRQRCVI
jgi:hypothetical protein